MQSSPEVRANSLSNHRILFIVLTNVISIACLVWVLHDANLGELRHEIEQLNWWWIGVAMISDVLVYVWDVFDRDGRRLHRFSGQETGSGSVVDPWQGIKEATVRDAARSAIDDLKAWSD